MPASSVLFLPVGRFRCCAGRRTTYGNVSMIKWYTGTSRRLPLSNDRPECRVSACGPRTLCHLSNASRRLGFDIFFFFFRQLFSENKRKTWRSLIFVFAVLKKRRHKLRIIILRRSCIYGDTQYCVPFELTAVIFIIIKKDKRLRSLWWTSGTELRVSRPFGMRSLVRCPNWMCKRRWTIARTKVSGSRILDEL